MYKILTIFVFLITGNALCQDQKNDTLPKFVHSFTNLSVDKLRYEADYIEDKETVIFKIYDDGELVNAYKLLIKDIHPKGIFFHQENDINYIRILSINNGTVFIEEKFRNGHRLSNTAKYVDIPYQEIERISGLDFINSFKDFVKSKFNSTYAPTKIEYITSPQKNNN